MGLFFLMLDSWTENLFIFFFFPQNLVALASHRRQIFGVCQNDFFYSSLFSPWSSISSWIYHWKHPPLQPIFTAFRHHERQRLERYRNNQLGWTRCGGTGGHVGGTMRAQGRIMHFNATTSQGGWEVNGGWSLWWRDTLGRQRCNTIVSHWKFCLHAATSMLLSRSLLLSGDGINGMHPPPGRTAAFWGGIGVDSLVSFLYGHPQIFINKKNCQGCHHN